MGQESAGLGNGGGRDEVNTILIASNCAYRGQAQHPCHISIYRLYVKACSIYVEFNLNEQNYSVCKTYVHTTV